MSNCDDCLIGEVCPAMRLVRNRHDFECPSYVSASRPTHQNCRCHAGEKVMDHNCEDCRHCNECPAEYVARNFAALKCTGFEPKQKAICDDCKHKRTCESKNGASSPAVITCTGYQPCNPTISATREEVDSYFDAVWLSLIGMKV